MNPVAIRASSLGELFDCPSRWAAKHIDKKFMPTSHKALLGKAIHASTAVYDQSVLDQNPISVEDAAGAAVDALFKPDEEVLWEDVKPSDLEPVALGLHKKYCTQVAPQQSYVAVEIQCDSLTIEDLGITLTGSTDRVRLTDDGYGIVDIKTGGAAVSADGTVATKGHAYQMGVYELLANNSSGLPITIPAQIVALNTGKTDKAQRVGTAEILDARSILLGDEYQQGVLAIASNIIHSGNFWGNPKSMMCHQNYCPNYSTCPFRK